MLKQFLHSYSLSLIIKCPPRTGRWEFAKETEKETERGTRRSRPRPHLALTEQSEMDSPAFMRHAQEKYNYDMLNFFAYAMV